MPTGTPLSDPPLIELIAEDPVLRDTKLIAEAWDCDGLNQVGVWRAPGIKREVVRVCVCVCVCACVCVRVCTCV